MDELIEILMRERVCCSVEGCPLFADYKRAEDGKVICEEHIKEKIA